jgi:hypothetical protein
MTSPSTISRPGAAWSFTSGVRHNALAGQLATIDEWARTFAVDFAAQQRQR